MASQHIPESFNTGPAGHSDALISFPEKCFEAAYGELREEIRQKRYELSDLYRSENPDKDQIDQKIEELNKLEAELDRSLSGY